MLGISAASLRTVGFLALAAPLVTQVAFAQPAKKFEPTWESLKKHQVPEWYQDAKLGIFVHWGLYSVPAWAPPTGELGKVDWNVWFSNNPYAEWYMNTWRIPGSQTRNHHEKTYGPNFDYLNFASTFNQSGQKWDPEDWAKLFQEVGARYVVLTTKHHDGFTLWPSSVKNPHRKPDQQGAQCDLVGDLTRAVRAHGMKMGLYYSGGLDWSFTEEPVKTMADLRTTAPQSEEYARYADAHWRELMQRYQPVFFGTTSAIPSWAR